MSGENEVRPGAFVQKDHPRPRVVHEVVNGNRTYCGIDLLTWPWRIADAGPATCRNCKRAGARMRMLEAVLPLAREGASNYTATELDEDYPGVRRFLFEDES